MLKYIYFMIIALNIGDAVATKSKLDIVEEKEPCSLHNLPCPEVLVKIASDLDPLSLSRLLRAHKKLGNMIRAQNRHTAFEPLPSGEGLLDEILLKHGIPNSESYVFDSESYVWGICQRLPYSFNKIFGAQMTWQGFPTELAKHRWAHIQWRQNYNSLPEIHMVNDLARLYGKISFGHGQEEDVQSFLEDTPERQQAIAYMRPRLLLGFISSSLGSYFGDDPYHTPHILSVCQCYETSIRKKHLSLQPQLNFELWKLHLRQAMWQAKVYRDAICFDHGKKVCDTAFREGLLSSLAIHKDFWVNTPYDPLLEIPLHHFARTTCGWLSKMIEMMGPNHFTKKETKEGLIALVNDQVNQLFFLLADSYVLNTTDDFISTRAFYYAEMAALAKKEGDKAIAYNKAGTDKYNHAQLLSAETAREQKAEAYAQSAFYRAKVGDLLTNDDKKAEAYNRASVAKYAEAQLLSAETDREKKAEALAQSTFYKAKAGDLFADNDKKAVAYSHAGRAQYDEAQLLSDKTDREKKAKAYAQSAVYQSKAGDLFTDNDKKAVAYNDAGLAKYKEAELLSDKTDREKMAKALEHFISFLTKAAELFTDNDKKARSHLAIGGLKVKIGQQKEAADYFQKGIDWLVNNEKVIGLNPANLRIMAEALKATNADARYLEWIKNQGYEAETPD